MNDHDDPKQNNLKEDKKTESQNADKQISSTSLVFQIPNMIKLIAGFLAKEVGNLGVVSKTVKGATEKERVEQRGIYAIVKDDLLGPFASGKRPEDILSISTWPEKGLLKILLTTKGSTKDPQGGEFKNFTIFQLGLRNLDCACMYDCIEAFKKIDGGLLEAKKQLEEFNSGKLQYIPPPLNKNEDDKKIAPVKVSQFNFEEIKNALQEYRTRFVLPPDEVDKEEWFKTTRNMWIETVGKAQLNLPANIALNIISSQGIRDHKTQLNLCVFSKPGTQFYEGLGEDYAIYMIESHSNYYGRRFGKEEQVLDQYGHVKRCVSPYDAGYLLGHLEEVETNLLDTYTKIINELNLQLEKKDSNESQPSEPKQTPQARS